MSETIASLVTSADGGDAAAAEQLFSTLYAELHRLAKRELSRGSSSSLGATTLLHEAYLSMSARDGVEFPDRARFMGYASRVMRGLIIDHVRRRRALKRGAGFAITTFDPQDANHQGADRLPDAAHLSRISEALDELARIEPALAELVDLKFFCGFSFTEVAAMRNVSERTVQRAWERARIYLHTQLRAELPAE